MKIACIDNYDSFVYNLVRYLKSDQEKPEVRIFRNTAIDFDYLDECDGILLSPGPGIPIEAGALMELIARFHKSKSILGICLGHQALGEFFGAKLEQCPEPIHGKASEINRILASPIFNQLPKKMQVGRYHSWRICLEEESELLVTSTSADQTIQSIQHKHLPLFGVQFHPESVLTPHGKQLIANWIQFLKHEKTIN